MSQYVEGQPMPPGRPVVYGGGPDVVRRIELTPEAPVRRGGAEDRVTRIEFDEQGRVIEDTNADDAERDRDRDDVVTGPNSSSTEERRDA